MKTHGNTGEITLNNPEKVLCAMLQVDSFDSLIEILKCLPNVTVTDVTNKNVTYRIIYDNWLKYQGDYSGDRVRKHRGNIKKSTVTDVTHQEEKRREKKRKEEGENIATKPDFVEQIKQNPAYMGIDVDRELSKMDAWLLTPKGKGKKKTPRFILNWLNRIEVPIITNGGQSVGPYKKL